MSLSLLFNRTQGQIGIVRMDATINEGHNKTSSVTSFPVEQGADISDHIRREAESIDIEGIVSDTPIAVLASVSALSPLSASLTSPRGRVSDAYDELQRIMNDGELVKVVTSLREYDNLAITSLAVTRNAGLGNALSARISLREVLTAETEIVDVPAPAPVSATDSETEQLGSQPSTPAPPPAAAENNSILAGWLS